MRFAQCCKYVRCVFYFNFSGLLSVCCLCIWKSCFHSPSGNFATFLVQIFIFLSHLFQLTPSPPLPVSLSLEDSELLSFYSSQSLAHLSCLADAVDVLFSSVKGNQPPRIFVARGKSLIVTAHKLVFIGDTLSRLLTSADLRAKVCGKVGMMFRSGIS